jgi:hypothetical protein
MKTSLLRIVACLPLVAMAEGSVLSGKVTDKSGKALSGVWVGLAQAHVATLTGSDGTWSIGGTGVVSRSGTRALASRHLVREGGRWTVSLQGRDIFGRTASGSGSAETAGVANAARATEDTPDTLLYIRDEEILAATPVATNPFAAGTVALDTAITLTYTTGGDTVVTTPTKPSTSVACIGDAMSIDPPESILDTNLVRHTADGIEMVSLNADLVYGPYQTVSKYHRLSGTPGSLQGRFQLVGKVYRATTAISDSAKQALVDDSAFYARQDARTVTILEIGAGTITRVGGGGPSFARTFVDKWNSPIEPWVYSAQDSVWVDYRQYSDSARYDIAVKIVDSNTVTLTGNVNQEVVTVAATPTLSGFDLIYSSTDPSHASGKSSAVPASCPDGVEWYQIFEWANFFQATIETSDPGTDVAARKAAKSAKLESVRRRPFTP